MTWGTPGTTDVDMGKEYAAKVRRLERALKNIVGGGDPASRNHARLALNREGWIYSDGGNWRREKKGQD